MKQGSPWLDTQRPPYPTLDHDLQVDILVIGGGITGITAAYLMKQAGKKVALVEKGTLINGETGHTTAHVTYPTDTRLTTLAKRFGKDHAQAAWDAQAAGAAQISECVTTEKIDCDLRHVPGFLFAALDVLDEEEAPRLMDDYHLAAELGFDTSYLQSAPLTERPAVRFANQLLMHPGHYLEGLAKTIPGDGCDVFEHSEVTEFSHDERTVTCNGHRITYTHVFVATHVPLQGKTGALSAMMFQTKLALYSTYAISAQAPKGSLPEALWWDTATPYFYLRIERGDTHDLIIAGGADHKTGQETDTAHCYEQVETTLRKFVPNAELLQRWSGQVIETNDGLPFIGEIAPGQYIATGFSGTGITWGTTAALMFRDHVMGVRNPWADLLSVDRKPIAEVWDYLKENKDYPYYLVKGLLACGDGSCSHLSPGEGGIVKSKGRKVAAYRDDDGKVTMLSPTCPHLGCTITWNDAEKTWDCPCHGSRFMATGELMGGPAEKPLEKIA